MFHGAGGVQWFCVPAFIAQALIYSLLELLDASIVLSLVFGEELLKAHCLSIIIG